MAGKKEDATAAEDETKELRPERIARWLRRHPDFFATRPDLLSQMTFPSRWSGDGVIDMQRYVLERRQEEIENLRNCAIEVIETSRSNLSSQTRTHAGALALVAAEDFDDLVGIVNDDLPLLLDVDVVTIGFEARAEAAAGHVSPHVGALDQGAVDRLLGNGRDVALVRDIGADGDLFGAAAGLVRSAALARLRPARDVPVGLLALGSRGDVFYSGQGTELVGFLAQVLEFCLRRCRENPPS